MLMGLLLIISIFYGGIAFGYNLEYLIQKSNHLSQLHEGAPPHIVVISSSFTQPYGDRVDVTGHSLILGGEIDLKRIIEQERKFAADHQEVEQGKVIVLIHHDQTFLSSGEGHLNNPPRFTGTPNVEHFIFTDTSETRNLKGAEAILRVLRYVEVVGEGATYSFNFLDASKGSPTTMARFGFFTQTWDVGKRARFQIAVPNHRSPTIRGIVNAHVLSAKEGFVHSESTVKVYPRTRRSYADYVAGRHLKRGESPPIPLEDYLEKEGRVPPWAPVEISGKTNREIAKIAMDASGTPLDHLSQKIDEAKSEYEAQNEHVKSLNKKIKRFASNLFLVVQELSKEAVSPAEIEKVANGIFFHAKKLRARPFNVEDQREFLRIQAEQLSSKLKIDISRSQISDCMTRAGISLVNVSIAHLKLMQIDGTYQQMVLDRDLLTQGIGTDFRDHLRQGLAHEISQMTDAIVNGYEVPTEWDPKRAGYDGLRGMVETGIKIPGEKGGVSYWWGLKNRKISLKRAALKARGFRAKLLGTPPRSR